MMMIVICFYKETSERPAAFSMKTAVYIFSALLPSTESVSIDVNRWPCLCHSVLDKKIVFICSINVDNVRFINVCIIIILLLFFKYPRLYKSQWLKTKIKLKTEWPTGPDRRR